MENVLLIAGAVVLIWFAVAAVVALGMGRAVRLADDRQRAQTAYRRATTAPRRAQAPTRVAVRAH